MILGFFAAIPSPAGVVSLHRLFLTIRATSKNPDLKDRQTDRQTGRQAGQLLNKDAFMAL